MEDVIVTHAGSLTNGGRVFDKWYNEGYLIRIKGGRTLYTDAFCNGGTCITLSYLKSTENGIKQVNRRVDWKTEIELVRRDDET